MSAEQPFQLGSVLVPPITAQQVREFKPGAFPLGASEASGGQSGSVSSLVRSAFQGILPRFVLSNSTSYYGDLHPDTLLPEGLGVMIFKQDASGIGSTFDGAFAPPPRRPSSSAASQSLDSPAEAGVAASVRIQTKQQFEEAAKRRSTLLLSFSAPFAAGDRCGGYWRNGLCEGEGALLTSTFTFQGQFSEGKPHGRGHMQYLKNFVDRMPVRDSGGTGGGGGGGIGSFLFKSLTTALLAPIPDVLLSAGASNALKPKDFIGDYHKTFLRHGKGVMRYANGDAYEGEWQYNRRDGYGKFTSVETGEQFEGHWQQDERHGYGKVVYPDGSFFKGLFDHGMRSGEGLLLFPNGDEYYGNFEKNRLQGDGTMKFKNGDLYTGSWKDGMRHGKGMYVLKKKRITVRGTFVKGLMEGEGVVEYPGTGVFTGDFERGERRFGSMFWFTRAEAEEQRRPTQQQRPSHATPTPPSAGEPAESLPGQTTGEPKTEEEQQQQQQQQSLTGGDAGFIEDPRRCYQGEWVGENMHGKGLLWFKNGDFFSGHFTRNARHGAGNMRYGGSSPAREYSGQFVADVRHGFGVEQSADGSVKAGRWDNDVFVEGYEGEWDGATLNGVGRLKLSLTSFFQNVENNKPLPSILSNTLSSPPIAMPSLHAFLRHGASSEPVLSVFAHPAQRREYDGATAAWATAVSAAQELNDIFMVEFFGIFRNGRRDGSGVLRLPYTCEKLPAAAAAATAAASQAGAEAAKPVRRSARRLFRLGSAKEAATAQQSGAARPAEEEDVSAAVQSSAAQHQLMPPTLLLRRHVVKGKWENNVLDCARGVWTFPNGETYVGGFAGNVRHQPCAAVTDSSQTEKTGSSRSEVGGGALLYFPDGSVFMGGWHRNAPRGKGVFICKDVHSPLYERRIHKSGSVDVRAGCDARAGGEEEYDGDGVAVMPVAQRESASRRRRELRRSLTRRAADGDGDEDRPPTTEAEWKGTPHAESSAAAATAASQQAPALAPPPREVEATQSGPGKKHKATLGSVLGIDFIVNLFTGAADTSSDDADKDTDNDPSTRTGEAARRQQERERLRKRLVGYDDHYFLFGQWWQEGDMAPGGMTAAGRSHNKSNSSDSDSSPCARASDDLTMPFSEYAKKIAPTLSYLPTSRRAACFEGTTMADGAMAFRPPPRELAGFLSSPYAQSSRESGSGAGGPLSNSSITSSSKHGESSDTGGSAAYMAMSSNGHAPTQYDDFYASLLSRDSVSGGPSGAPVAAWTGEAGALPGDGGGGGGSLLAPATVGGATARTPISRPSPPEAVNLARASGQGIYVYPSTGVCVQAFFLDNMPRLAVPYRPGSELDRYLAKLKTHYRMLGASFATPSQCSDVSYLLKGLKCLRCREEFAAPCALMPHREEDDSDRDERRDSDSPEEKRDVGEQPMQTAQQGLGVTDACITGSPFAAAIVNQRRRRQARGAERTTASAALTKPEPLEQCTRCGKGYSFFREASCCTLCFRSCCSACLNSYEILGKPPPSSSAPSPLNSTGRAGPHTGYSEVSALLASSYYLLQKLKKGPEAFKEEETRANDKGSGVDAGVAAEVTSRQLLTLLSGTATVPVCADCVRCILMRVERQVQWIPLKLFSSVMAFESEDKLEAAQARAAERDQRRLRHQRQAQRDSVEAGGREADLDGAAAGVAQPTSREESAAARQRRGEAEELPLPATGWEGAEQEMSKATPPPQFSTDGQVDSGPREGTPPREQSFAAAPTTDIASPEPMPPPPPLPMSVEESLPRVAAERVDPVHLPPLSSSSLLPNVMDADGAAPLQQQQHRGDAEDEGYAIYSGYTSHGIPHLCGEMWWWPGDGMRERFGGTEGDSAVSMRRRGLESAQGPYELLSVLRLQEREGADEGSGVSSSDGEGGERGVAARRDGARDGPGASTRYLNTRVLDVGKALSDRHRRRRRRDRSCSPPDATAATAALTIVDRGSPMVAAAARAAARTPSRGDREAPARGALQSPQLRYYYAGSFSAGKRCGHGSVIFENGEKYVGFFHDNHMHGEGFYFSDDGAVVHGHWRQGKLTCVYYIGELDEPTLQRAGTGIGFYDALHRSHSLYFSVEDTNGDDRHGTSPAGPPGNDRLPQGAEGGNGTAHAVPSAFLLYNGQWRKGRKHGSGTLHMRGGITYLGTFRHDRMQGRGTLTTPFSLFSGAFKNNRKNGHGIELFFDIPGTRDARRTETKKRGLPRGTQSAPVSSAVEGNWQDDVSHDFVRIYEKKTRRATVSIDDGRGSKESAPPPAPETEAGLSLDSRPPQQASTEGEEYFEVTETTYRNGNERDDCFSAPLMRSDEERDQCALCDKKFHMFLRRHHCRLCGELVCDSCSQRRARLPDHFYASEEEKKAFQAATREAAFRAAAQSGRAVAGTVHPTPSSTTTATAMTSGAAAAAASSTPPPAGADEDGGSDDGNDGSGNVTNKASGGGGGANVPSAPQRVCDVCFFRLEQRRTLVVKKYADHSVYCGGMSRGHWVSRGLYWRADGLFFVFDEQGKLLLRDGTGAEATATAMQSGAAMAGLGGSNKSFALSASVLQDAAPGKEVMDGNPVPFSESSPTAELDKFLLWWVSMNTRCQLSLAVLDFPQLRAYKLLFSLSRKHGGGGGHHATAAASTGANFVSALSQKPVGGAAAQSGGGAAARGAKGCVVLAGSPEAHVLSVANLFPSRGVASPAHTEAKGKTCSLTVDAVSLRIAHDFQKWLHFPRAPALPRPARFISYSDAVRMNAENVAAGLPSRAPASASHGTPHPQQQQQQQQQPARDPNVEAALVRAARYHPCPLPRPPPYPLSHKTQDRHRDHNGEAAETNPSRHGGASAKGPLSLLPHPPPPPLSQVDIHDEELLRDVADERIESFLPFPPPSQQGEAQEGDMKVLACYRYQPLFPLTPSVPAFRENASVPWDHWHTHPIPVFNPTRLPLTHRHRRPAHATPSAAASVGDDAGAGVVFDERQLYYGCAFPPVTVDACNEAIEDGKISKVAELMVSREQRAMRQARRRHCREEQQRRREAAKGRANPEAKQDASETASTSTDSTESSCTGDDEDSHTPRNHCRFHDAEIVDGMTALSLAATAARPGNPTVTASNSGAGAVNGKGISAAELAGYAAGSGGGAGGKRQGTLSAWEKEQEEALQAVRAQQHQQHQQQIATLLTMSRNDKAWLPEPLDGPFKFSLRCHNV